MWNLKNKLNKQNRDRLIESRLTALWRRGWGLGEIEQKRKKGKELMDSNNSAVIAEGREVGGGGRGYGGDIWCWKNMYI